MMEPQDNNIHKEKREFQLYEHPWLSLLAVIATSIISMFLSAVLIFRLGGLNPDSPSGNFASAITSHILTAFIFVPLFLRLPKGKRTFREYLADIGLSRIRPFVRLLTLALSCSVILALSQAAASFVYRLLERQPISAWFVRQVFDLSGAISPEAPELLAAFPSAFEELVFRGILLTVFLSKYSERKSIIFSSLGFGLIHLLNLSNGRELVWVMGQVVWAFTIGLFYGYVFVRTRSLLPSMIVHYLGNVMVGLLAGYMQSRASVEIQVLYGVILSFGILPTTLMILWTRFFISRWLPAAAHERSDVEAISGGSPILSQRTKVKGSHP
ncbi:lysostaphin resistance A-like protein [Chloroflexota bacterium]